jgi:hypothetical protein
MYEPFYGYIQAVHEEKNFKHAKYTFFMALATNNTAFWEVTLCGLDM